MKKFAFAFLSIFVFSLPAQAFLVIPGLGTISRLLGIALIIVAISYILFKRNVKEPSVFIIVFGVFVLWNVMSYIWSQNPSSTLTRFVTNIQLLAMVWLIWELSETKQDYYRLMQMYVLGLYISIFDMMRTYFTGSVGSYRVAAGAFDHNELALMLALGIPMAWHLFLNYKKHLLYYFNLLLIPLAIFCIVLTASRGGMFSGLLGLMIIVLTFHKLNVAGKILASLFLLIIISFSILKLPEILPRIEQNIDRIAGAYELVVEERFGSRGEIWSAGVKAFSDSNPLLGVGSRAYGAAITEYYTWGAAAHNTYLSIMVETGIIGISLFVLILFILLRPIFNLNYSDIVFYLILIIILLAAMTLLHLEAKKVLWFILALFQANSSMLYRGKRIIYQYR